MPAKPILPSTKSPVPGYEDRGCGEATWHMQVEIRAPYQGMDKYAEALPPILGAYEANSTDLDESIPIFYDDSNLARISDAIAGAREILDRYQSEGYVGSSNADSIRVYITRAAQYLSQARSLKDEWDKYSSGAGSPGWPLTESSMIGCEGKVAPEQGESFGFGGGGGADTVKWLCPTQAMTTKHAADRQLFRDLAYAAMVNARCAQEAASAVGVHGRNKEAKTPSRGPSIGGLSTARPGPRRGLVAATQPTGEGPEGADISPTDVEEEAAPRKKKDNTMLIVGAAALGILVLSKK